MNSPSVQLYTVRDAMAEDLPGAIARVAEIGYTKVEPYAFDHQEKPLAKALADNGLQAPSGHTSVIDSDRPEAVFEAAANLGIGIVIDPFVPTERWQTADHAAKIAERVNELAELAVPYGLKFGYHNHNWEFSNRVDGRSVFEFFVEKLSPLVVLEIDTFWSTVGGADTPAVLSALGERVQLLHIKDGPVKGAIASSLPSSEDALVVPEDLMRAFNSQEPAGKGEVDIPSILQAAPHALRVVEFDGYAGDVFEGITESLAWLKANDNGGQK